MDDALHANSDQKDQQVQEDHQDHLAQLAQGEQLDLLVNQGFLEIEGIQDMEEMDLQETLVSVEHQVAQGVTA